MLTKSLCRSLRYELREVVTSRVSKRGCARICKMQPAFGRLEQMTGIRERRVWEEGTPPACRAQGRREGIASARIDKKDIECLLRHLREP